MAETPFIDLSNLDLRWLYDEGDGFLHAYFVPRHLSGPASLFSRCQKREVSLPLEGARENAAFCLDCEAKYPDRTMEIMRQAEAHEKAHKLSDKNRS